MEIRLNHIGHSWPFADPPNTAVFTSVAISLKLQSICWVSHDEEDGAWQFHGGSASPQVAEAAVVSLRTILNLDPSVAELSDLPEGWCASRASPIEPWIRRPRER
jgi:hypothetical protein